MATHNFSFNVCMSESCIHFVALPCVSSSAEQMVVDYSSGKAKTEAFVTVGDVIQCRSSRKGRGEQFADRIGGRQENKVDLCIVDVGTASTYM